MDSISKLSLLEIEGEDDSLLLDDCSSVSSTATNVFSSSPLLSLRSKTLTEARPCAVDSENLSSSPTKDLNKENMNWSAPKLSVEPQNMKKRKKKGGGYNLRKSLAWDRAFFTEQGVLNPLELSMISGTSTPSRTNTDLKLNIIDEEEEGEPTSASLAIRQIEENLFKQSSHGSSRENRNIGAVGLSPKPAPSSVAKRKVLAVNDMAGNSSKRNACPRPVASSSPNTAKAPSKESKFSKIPGPKSNASVITTTARSGTLSTGSSKRNQSAHPATNVQKYAGVKGLSKNPRTVLSNPKIDLADRPSVTRATKQAGKYLDNSVCVTHPPSRPHQRGTEANKISEACLPQGISDTSEKKQQTHIQTTKPSGLRMPSPSLAFFSQTKVSSSHSQLKQSSKSCKPAECNIPKLRKLEANSVDDARLPHAPRKRSEIVGVAAKHHTDKLSLSDVKSEPSMQEDEKQMAGIEVRCDSLGCEKISDQEKVNNKQMSGVEVECDSLDFEKISKKEMAENILERANIKSKEQAELHKSDNVSNMGDVQFPTHKKLLLSKSHIHEQLEKEADHSSEDKSYDVLSNGDQSVFQEPQSMHHHSMPRTSIGTDDISNTMHDAVGQAEDEQSKLLTCDVLTCNNSLVLQAKHGPSSKHIRLSGEFMEYNCVKTALINSSSSISSETVLGGSLEAIPFKNTEWVNEGSGDFPKCGDELMHLLDGNLSIHCNNTTESILEAVNQHLQGEQLKTPNPSIVEVSSKDENESHVNSCPLVLVTTLSSKGSHEKSRPEINDACENEPRMAEIDDCQHPVDGESGSIQRRSVNEGYDRVIDSKVVHDKNQTFELHRMCEDGKTVSAIAGSTEANNISPESIPFYENNIENFRFTSELCPVVKSECYPRGNDMSVNNSCTISELQLRKDGLSRETSMQCDVPGYFEKQTSVLTYNGILCEDESLVLNHGHSLDESGFSEVSADFIASSKDSPQKSIPEVNDACENEPKIAEIEDCQRPLDGESGSIQRTPVDETLSSKGSHEMSTPEINDACENEPKIAEIEDCQRQLDGESGSIQRRPVDETLSLQGSHEMSTPEINDACENEPKIAEIEDCQHPVDGESGSFQRRPVDEGYDQIIDSKVIHPVDGESGSFQRRPVDEGYDQIIDSKVIHDKVQAFELDRMCEDCMTVSSTACSTEVKNVSPESRPFYQNNIENLHFTSELCPMLNAECDSMGNDMSVQNSCTISELQLRKDGSVWDTSMQCDVQCDLPGNFEQQASMLAYNEIIEMLYEDESLVPNHGHSLDESELSEVSADFIPGTKDSIGSGAEYPSGLLQHTLLAHSVSEFDHNSREIEESRMEDAQAQTFNEDPVIYYCNDEECLSVSNDQFPLADDSNISEEPHLSKLHLDGDLLSTNTASSEEIKKENLFEGVLEGCEIYSSEHNASNHFIQAMHENKDASLDVDEKAEQPEMRDAKKDSTDMLPSFEVRLDPQVISAEFDSSTRVSEDPITEVGHRKSDEHCSLRENSKSPASDNLTFHARVLQGSEVSSFNSRSFSEEAETNIFEKEESPNTDMQHQTEDGICFVEDSSKTIHLEKSETNSKQEVPTLKPPPNVAPFSDEWLAAIEAAGERFYIIPTLGSRVKPLQERCCAGEDLDLINRFYLHGLEILTMKSGAVQNSPPEKPQHEPSPWSPVKRKSQSIGPFDCTKHTNIPHSSS